MTHPVTAPNHSSIDVLGDYVTGVNKLSGKMAQIAANKRSSADSLGRAAAALRSMAALNRRSHDSTSGKPTPMHGNSAGVSR